MTRKEALNEGCGEDKRTKWKWGVLRARWERREEEQRNEWGAEGRETYRSQNEKQK